MLAFDRCGEGPPLLLLHGTASSRGVWAPLIDTLAEANDVFAVDLPGHGDSPPTS
jgi:pimeloyl-ACP methyl ester carboxylesterase